MLAPKLDDNESASNPPADDDNDHDDDTLKYTRFSKYAPDTSLSSEDFRAQLKENMKADLERRRRENPNRGNQPAKSYLDSLWKTPKQLITSVQKSETQRKWLQAKDHEGRSR